MVMNPRTHPRGAAPDFALPRPNPNLSRMTDALWWLVCMRLDLEPLSRNGGTFADKPGYHNAGENLPGHGAGGGGKSTTDHSIRWAPDRAGPWWREMSSAHDWTFVDAQNGDYRTIAKYTNRLIRSMQDPRDTRPDSVYAYTLGQGDSDRAVEGYNERTDDAESSGDLTHLWHRHDSFRRNIIGSYAAMWKALTIDMGWTYAEWLKSVTPAKPEEKPVTQPANETLKLTETAGRELFEPDRPAGTEVAEDTVDQLSAIWAKRATEAAVKNGVSLAAIEERVIRTEEKLDQVLALLQPAEPTA